VMKATLPATRPAISLPPFSDREFLIAGYLIVLPASTVNSSPVT
jgi:hypothetical protein